MSSSEKSINRNSKVWLNFSLALAASGELVDTNFDQPAAAFVFGDGSLLPKFEEVLLGLEVNQEAEFTIAAVDAFGDSREDNIHQLTVSQFKDIKLEKGLMINFAGPTQQANTGVVVDFNNTFATLDFNHPLAGQDILFKVHIEDIQPQQQIFIQQVEAQ